MTLAGHDSPMLPTPAAISWRVLGSLEGLRQGCGVQLGPPRQRAILTLLLARVGQSTPLSVIVDALWRDSPPTWAVNVVHKHIGALRRIVDPALPRRAQGTWLLNDANGYRIVADVRTLDLVEFRHHCEQAGKTGDPRGRLHHLCAGLDLWRGPVAENIPSELRDHATVSALEREHASIALEAAAIALTVHEPERMLSALRRASHVDPTGEVLHAMLMRCLAAAGRRAEALGVFEDLRHALQDGLGVSPGPALSGAHLEILRDDMDALPPTQRAMPKPAQLPAGVRGFVAREHELIQLRTALVPGDTAVAVAITGTAGVGKTSLALKFAHEVAHTFPDGQLYVDLRGFAPGNVALAPRDVLWAFLEALHVAHDKVPSDLDGRASLYRSVLADRRVLVVLDNAHDTAQVRPLLPGGGDSATIITSRVQLRGLVNDGVHALTLRLFDAEQSAQFLRQRLPGRHLDDAALDALFDITAGLPLALTLLAARTAQTPDLKPEAVAGSIRRTRSALDAFVDSADPRTDPRSVLSWSYDSLSPDAAVLLRRMALHPGPSVSVVQAASLAAKTSRRTQSLLSELVEANIIAEVEPHRYAQHDLLKEYAAERLAAEESTHARLDAERRLYGFFANASIDAAMMLSPGRVPLTAAVPSSKYVDVEQLHSEYAAAAWFEAQHGTLIALIAQAAPGTFDAAVVHIAWALVHYLDRRGKWDELLATQASALQSARRLADPDAEAAAHRGIARAETNRGRLDRAVGQVSLALQCLDRDPTARTVLRAETHRQMSWILEQQEKFEDALAHAREALAAYPDGSTEPARAFALNAVGWCEALVGEYEAAIEHCEGAVALLDGTEFRYGRADTLSSLGYINVALGRNRAAVTCYRRAYRLFQKLGVRYAEADTALHLGQVLANADRPMAARYFLDIATTIFTDLQHSRAADADAVIAGLGTASTAAEAAAACG